MSIWQALVLGVIQGITEFFPVSSSGHLVIFQNLFGIKEPQLAFDIFLHLGTSAAVMIFFRKDILRLFTDDRKTLFFIVAASVPTFIIGFFFKDSIESLFGAGKMVGYMLLVTGLWLGLAARMGRIGRSSKKDVGIADSVMIGISQGIAVIPGISRSGATIATGMMLGVDKEKACRFSFLLSLPAVLGAAVLKARGIASGVVSQEAAQYLAGAAVAMLVGMAAIKILLELVKSDRFYLFSVYCIVAGFFAIITL